MPLTDEQWALLDEPLDPRLGTYRKADKGRDVSYLEGYQVIAQANRIFGFDGWGYSVDRLDQSVMADGSGMLYWCLVTVTVEGCPPRQDIGCHVIRNTVDQDGKVKDNVNNPDQHDLARKSAVTDALKRAFRSFGDQFGNSLYDKDSNIHQAIHEAVHEEYQRQRETQRSDRSSHARPKIVAQQTSEPRTNQQSVKQRLEAEIKGATTLDLLKATGRKVKTAVEAKQVTDEERANLLRIYAERERALTPQLATA